MATAPAPDDYFAQAQQQGGAGGQQQQPDPQAEKEKRERNEEMRRGILARILDGEARERCKQAFTTYNVGYNCQLVYRRVRTIYNNLTKTRV